MIAVGHTPSAWQVVGLPAWYCLKTEIKMPDMFVFPFLLLQDGNVDNVDSAVVPNYDNGTVDIDQQLNETAEPVGIYFGQPIGF